MTQKICNFWTVATLAISPLVFVKLPLAGRELSPTIFMIVPLAICWALRRSSVSDARRVASDYWPFWGANLMYLMLMVVHTIFTPGTISATYFLSRIWFLATAFLLACHLSTIRDHRSWLRILLTTAMAGSLIFVAVFYLSARQSGISLFSELQTLLTGSMDRWQRVTMLVFNDIQDGEVLQEDSVVFKNPISVTLAMYAFFALANLIVSDSVGKRILAGITIFAASLWVLVLLSKSVITGLLVGVAVMFFVYHQPRRPKTAMFIGLICIFLTVLAAAVVLSGNAGAISQKFLDEASYQGRLAQVSEVMDVIETPKNFLFGIGPSYAFDNDRVHNLFLGGLAEGGVLGLATLATQFIFPFLLLIKWTSRLRRADSICSILLGLAWAITLLSANRSMIGGASGYHDSITFLGMAVVFAILSHVSGTIRSLASEQEDFYEPEGCATVVNGLELPGPVTSSCVSSLHS